MNHRAAIDCAPIPFVDVAAQRRRLGRSVDDAIARVLSHCQFIMGPEVRALEVELAAFCGVGHAVSCASGTDALLLILIAKGVGPGDAVICPSFTFTATAEVVALIGATPVFADVEEASFNLDPESLQRACATARKLGLHPKAVIPVDLFGQPADYARIASIADSRESVRARRRRPVIRRRPMIIDVSVHSRRRRRPASFRRSRSAAMAMVEPCSPTTRSLPQVMRSVRVHGEGRDKYECVRIGLNGRLDTMQAAVLIEKLKIFPDEIVARERAARRYSAGLADVATVPELARGATSVWAQYTLRLAPGRRDALAASLATQGIPTAVHYPIPLHRQRPYQRFPVAEGGAPISDRLAAAVISLPMHAYLDEAIQDRIIAAVRCALST